MIIWLGFRTKEGIGVSFFMTKLTFRLNFAWTFWLKSVFSRRNQQPHEQRVVCLWWKLQFPTTISVVHTYMFPRFRLLPLATVKATVPPNTNNQYGELDNIISLEEFRNLLSLGPISTLNDDLNFFCSILVSVYAAV